MLPSRRPTQAGIVTDIRIKVGFLTHPKTVKLRRRCGSEGVESIISLWCFAADTEGREAGSLAGMDTEDIEIAAKWRGESGAFVDAAIAVGFLDAVDNHLVIHDWTEHQPWVALAPVRAAAGKKAVHTRWHNKGAHGEPVDGCPLCLRSVYDSHTPRINPQYGNTESVIPLSLPSPSLPSLSSPSLSLPNTKRGVLDPPASPPPAPASPTPPEGKKVEDPKPAKAKRRKASHKTLEGLLGDKPAGTYMGKPRDGTRTYLDIWEGHFTHLEDLAEECAAAWDHIARKKRSDMVLYMVRWLKQSNERAKDAWSRRPENRPQTNESPGGRNRNGAPTPPAAGNGVQQTNELLSKLKPPEGEAALDLVDVRGLLAGVFAKGKSDAPDT